MTTLLDTTQYEDAILCGYDGRTEIEDDGFCVSISDFTTLTISTRDGEAQISGLPAIEQLMFALQRVVAARVGVAERRAA